MSPVPCPGQPSHLHGLGDPFYVLLGFLDPVLQRVQHLPHLLDVLNHICGAKGSNLTRGTQQHTHTLFLGTLGVPCGGVAPAKASTPSTMESRRHCHCGDFSGVKCWCSVTIGHYGGGGSPWLPRLWVLPHLRLLRLSPLPTTNERGGGSGGQGTCTMLPGPQGGWERAVPCEGG